MYTWQPCSTLQVSELERAETERDCSEVRAGMQACSLTQHCVHEKEVVLLAKQASEGLCGRFIDVGIVSPEGHMTDLLPESSESRLS